MEGDRLEMEYEGRMVDTVDLGTGTQLVRRHGVYFGNGRYGDLRDFVFSCVFFQYDIAQDAAQPEDGG